MAIFAEVTEDECINDSQPLVKGDIMTNTVLIEQFYSGQRRDIGCKLVLFTNRKLQTGFRLV